MIDKEVDVVQWSRFDPRPILVIFIRNLTADRALQNWTWIDIKRDWFAAHAPTTASIFALVRLRAPRAGRPRP